MINQLLFGDLLRIINREERWALVQQVYDGYTGWIDPKQFTAISPEEFIKLGSANHVTAVSAMNRITKYPQGDFLYIVPGCSIPGPADTLFSINGQQYRSPSDIIVPQAQNFAEKIEETARFYLNSPYLWGGRSPYGIDCSGFCQVVFKMLGIKLKRDSLDQALQGETVHFLPEAKPGDLAFFDNADGAIIHVGIVLSESRIIHASGRVKIDVLDDQGIYSGEFGKHTHKLRIIKRLVS